MGESRTVRWEGELLWPAELPAAEVIDLSGVTALGAWCHEWFRRHPGQAVTGGGWKERLLRAGVPVRWCDEGTAAGGGAGVSADEREMLWG
jgi:hypothetical protein